MFEHTEEWRQTEFPNLWISNQGRVRRSAYILTRRDGIKKSMPEKIYRGVLSPSGYLYVSAKPHKDSVAVHELVAKAFIGPKPKEARTVNHRDGNKTNNAAGNLEWATYKENNRHARIMLLNKQHGERCNLTKFSDDVVDAVRILAAAKRFTYAEIGGFFNMSASHVKEVVGSVSRARPTEHS